jgi:hypothetical protein
VANRLFVLSLAALFLVGALTVHPRRAVDWQRVVDRIAPRPIFWTALRLSPLLALVIGLGMYNWIKARTGFPGAVVERQSRDSWRRNVASFPADTLLPALAKVIGSVDIDPFDRSLCVQGTYVVRNPHATPMEQIPLTQGAHWRNVKWTLDGKPMDPMKKDSLDPPPTVEDRAGLWVFTPARPLATGETATIGFPFDGVFPSGWTRNGGGAGEFILPSGVVLTSFSPSFMPAVGFQEGVGVDHRYATDPKEPLPDDWKKQTDPAFGSAWGFDVTLQVTGPEEWTLNCVGIPGEPVVKDGRKTVTWTTDVPVRFFNIAGGPLERLDGTGSSIFHSPRHPWNLKTMSEALDASRELYGKWFGEYPRRDLRLTEFPGLAGYAQGVPGNITFSALLLTLEKRGDEQRQRMLRQWEDDYANGRSADSERPMVRTSGTRPGDQTVTYDKAGWVFLMMMEVMGRDAMLSGLQDFIRTYQDGPDCPLLQDLVVLMRRRARDLPTYDAFTRQWFEQVMLPEFKLWDLKVTKPAEGQWVVEGTLENAGTGTVSVEVAAIGAQPKKPDDAPADAKAPMAPNARTAVSIGAGERKHFRIVCPFKPVKSQVDPEVRVLQVRRKLAESMLPKA